MAAVDLEMLQQEGETRIDWLKRLAHRWYKKQLAEAHLAAVLIGQPFDTVKHGGPILSRIDKTAVQRAKEPVIEQLTDVFPDRPFYNRR